MAGERGGADAEEADLTSWVDESREDGRAQRRAAAEDTGAIAIYYDGECPFCANYVRLLRLREEFGVVRLVDLRTDHAARERFETDGLDLDDGMVVEVDGMVRHGHDAVHALAVLGAPNGLFNNLNKRLFRSANRSRLLYPAMRAARNVTLRLLGRQRIGNIDAR